MICIYIRPDPAAKTVAKLRHNKKADPSLISHLSVPGYVEESAYLLLTLSCVKIIVFRLFYDINFAICSCFGNSPYNPPVWMKRIFS